jgi:hypothetical protein
VEKQPVASSIGQPRQNNLTERDPAGEQVFRRATGRRHLLVMDDEQALRALPVARAAFAWRHSKSDTEPYRRLVVATGEWDDYVAPQLVAPDASDVAAQLRRAARRALRAMDDEQAERARNVALPASD